MGRNRVMLLGIDGGDWTIINELINRGSLPKFKEIIEKGIYSTPYNVPPWTPSMWTSVSTGKNLQNHGIFSFVKITQDYNISMVTSKDKERKDVWEYIDGTCIVQNLPMTYPASRKKKLQMITGMLTPELNNRAFSNTELKEFIEKLGGYRIEPKMDLEDIFKTIEKRLETNKKLMEKYSDWKLNLVVVRATDPLQHRFWELNNLEKAYKLIDNFLGWFISKYPDSSLIIVSDHGFRKVSQEFRILKFLEERGYLKLKRESKGIRKKIIENLVSISKSLPTSIKERVPYSIKNKIAPNVQFDKDQGRSNLMNKLDISSSSIFLGGWGEIYINSKYFSNGFIEQEEINSLKEKLKKDLLSFKDPKTGKRPIKDILFVEDVNKSIKSKAPDLYIVPNTEDGYCISLSTEGDILRRAGRVGEHYPEGIFIAYNPRAKGKGEIEGVKLVDIAPTILDLLDIQTKDEFDGSAIRW